MLRILLALLLSAFGLAAHAQEKMNFFEYSVGSPQLSATSPESKPRKLWLVGKKYMRFEDIPNPETRIHGLIIVSEPDIWVIDRNTNKGQHALDPGPTYAVHFPMLPTEPSEVLRQLEFGREVDFFERKGAQVLPPQLLDGMTVRVLQLEIDDRDVRLYLKDGDIPVQVTVAAAGISYAIRFLKYELNREPDFSLFKLPPGVQLK